MKTATKDGVEVRAAEGAPKRAACTRCGDRVELRYQRKGGWYYRHVPGGGPDCPLRTRPIPEGFNRRPPKLVRGSPELTLAVKITTRAAGDALSGDERALVWLVEHPLPRITLDVLGIDPDLALARLAGRVGVGTN